MADKKPVKDPYAGDRTPGPSTLPKPDYHRGGDDVKATRARGNQSDPGYDLSVDGGTLRAKIKSPSERIANEVEASRGKESNRYASGGRVRGVGAAVKGFGRGKIC